MNSWGNSTKVIIIGSEVQEYRLEKDKLKPVSIKLPQWQMQKLDELHRQDKYASRSEMIRYAVRDLLKRRKGKY